MCPTNLSAPLACELAGRNSGLRSRQILSWKCTNWSYSALTYHPAVYRRLAPNTATPPLAKNSTNVIAEGPPQAVAQPTPRARRDGRRLLTTGDGWFGGRVPAVGVAVAGASVSVSAGTVGVSAGAAVVAVAAGSVGASLCR